MDKKVLVLGSAPGARIPADIDSYFVIAANAAIAQFPDLVPDVLFLNAVTLKTDKGIGPESRNALRARSAKKVVVIDNQAPGFAVRAVINLGLVYDEIEFITKFKRVEICEQATGLTYEGFAGGDVVPSTGVTALCYALSLSSGVTISGIDVESDGHNYSVGNHKREHVEIDKKTLKAIAGKFEVIDV